MIIQLVIADPTVKKCSKTSRRSALSVLLAIMLSVSLSSDFAAAQSGPASSSIVLYDFSWTKNPLKVYVDVNEWSMPSYSLAVRDALNSWVRSIWNYTHTFTNMTLDFSYTYYVSDTNKTDACDVFISFSQNEIEHSAVGLTSVRWNPILHDPVTPIIINITSYSGTAEDLFIRNVAMHEFGHALGLGHASSQNTENGQELMYPSSSLRETVFPSTLDVYGLLVLHGGSYGSTVSLPSNVPHMMLTGGSIPPQDQTFPDSILSLLVNELDIMFYNPSELLSNPIRLLVPCFIWILIALVLGLLSSETGAVIGSTILSILACYSLRTSIDLQSLILKIVSVLPPIAIGASIAGLVRSRETAKETQGVDAGTG